MTRPKLGFSLETLTGQNAKFQDIDEEQNNSQDDLTKSKTTETTEGEETTNHSAGTTEDDTTKSETIGTTEGDTLQSLTAGTNGSDASKAPPARTTRGLAPHNPPKPIRSVGGRPAREPYDRIHVNVALSLIEFTNARWRNYTLRNGKLAANRNEYIEDLIARDRERAIALNEQARKTG